MKHTTTLSKALLLTMKIITIVALCGMAIALIGGIVCLCLPQAMFESLTCRVKLSGFEMRFNVAVIAHKYAKAQIVLNVLRGFIIVTIAFVICLLLTKIIKNIVDAKPFAAHNSKYIMIIGICVAILAVAPNGLNFLIDTYILEVANANEVLLGLGDVTAVNPSGNFVNIAVLLLGVLIIFLSEVFRRGKFLQDEYDATI